MRNMTRLVLRPAPQARAGINQRGVTLVMSLIFLLLLTILGVTAMNTSTLQEKMAGNLRDQDVAFQAAESALRGGEDEVNQLAQAAGGKRPADGTNCTACVWKIGTTSPWDDTASGDAWWASYGNVYDGAGSLTGVNANPAYVIEYGGFVRDDLMVGNKYGGGGGVDYYRITSRSVGATANARSMLESTYRVRF